MRGKNKSLQNETVRNINHALNALAKPPGLTEREYPWIVFSLDDTEYAINARFVLRVAVLHEIVPYSGAPAYCPGVIWDRNGIIRLLDLHVLLGRGKYLEAAVRKEKNRFPMIIIIEPDGKRRGMIVDKIIMLKYADAFIDGSLNEGFAQSPYVKGSIKYDAQKGSALIIRPESFNALEFESQNVKIDWQGRIDMEMKAEPASSGGDKNEKHEH